MSDAAYADFTEQVLALSYDQTLLLMAKMLESLKQKKAEADFAEMENVVTQSHANAVWEELKDDAW